MAHDMLHVISAWCVAHDLYMTAPWPPEQMWVARDWHMTAAWPFERMYWRQLAAQWGDDQKSQMAPFHAIINYYYQLLWHSKTEVSKTVSGWTTYFAANVSSLKPDINTNGQTNTNDFLISCSINRNTGCHLNDSPPSQWRFLSLFWASRTSLQGLAACRWTGLGLSPLVSLPENIKWPWVHFSAFPARSLGFTCLFQHTNILIYSSIPIF